METNKLLLRLRTPEGHSRLTVPSDTTVAQLHALVAAHLRIAAEKISLFLDQSYAQELLPTEQRMTLQEKGVRTGSEVFVVTAAGERTFIAAAPAVLHHMSTSDLPPVSKEDIKSDTSTTTTTKNTGKSGASSQAAGENSVSSGRPSVSSSSSSSSGGKCSNSSNAWSAAGGAGGGGESAGGGNGGGGGTTAVVAGTTFKAFDAFLRERNFVVIDLPGSVSYTPRKLEAGKMNKIPATVSLKHQVYRHVDHLEIMNVEEVKNFVHLWQHQLHMLQQRFGYMFGYYIEDPHYPDGIRAVCEAIYEPPQENTLTSIKIDKEAEKKELSVVEQVAEHLGLELIGCIFTHAPREELLTADEVVELAKLQLAHQSTTHYTGYPVSKFVCCTVALDQQDPSGGEAVPNAFMISDLGMALVRDGVICEKQPDDQHIQLREAQKGELLPQVLKSGTEVTKFDASWFIVRVNESAPKKVRSFFKFNDFPRENRLIKQTPKDISEHLKRFGGRDARKEESWRAYSDFHLLIYIAQLFDLPTAISLCESVRNQEPVNEGLAEILNSLG